MAVWLITINYRAACLAPLRTWRLYKRRAGKPIFHQLCLIKTPIIA